MPETQTDPLAEPIETLDRLLRILAAAIAERTPEAEAASPRIDRLLTAAAHVRHARLALTPPRPILQRPEQKEDPASPDTQLEPRVTLPPPDPPGFHDPLDVLGRPATRSGSS
jgi:hypothetical protein